MKKNFALGLAGVMIMTALAGCGSSSSEYLMDVDYSKYVKLCDYTGVETTKIVYDVTDEEIQEQVELGMYDFITYDPVTDRGVEVGDYALITYSTTIDGEVNADYSAEGEDVLVGEGYLFPELEDALIGMKTGENKTVEVELTEDYVDENLVGKKASVDVTLTEITVENMPEYDENFVKENTEYESMEAYEAALKEELLASKEEEYTYVAVEEIMEYLLENSKFDGYPEELYTRCEEMYDSNNEFYASMYGMTVEEYLEMFGTDEATKKSEIEASVNYELIIGAIAQKEKIECSDQDIDDYIEANYESYGYDSAEEFLEDYNREDVGYELIYQSVVDLLYEKAKFNEMSEADYLAEQEAYYMDEVEGEEEEEIEPEDIEETTTTEEYATEESVTTEEASTEE